MLWNKWPLERIILDLLFRLMSSCLGSYILLIHAIGILSKAGGWMYTNTKWIDDIIANHEVVDSSSQFLEKL